MTVLLVALGAAVGAPARYLTDLVVQSRNDSVLPWGTFVVNVVGSFVLGVVASAVTLHDAPAWLMTLVGTGFCGALTTFSTFGLETVRLVEEGWWAQAVLNVAGSLVVGLGACASGWAIVAAF